MVDFDEMNPIKLEVSCSAKWYMQTHQNGEPGQKNYVVDSAISLKSEPKWPKDLELDRHVR